MEARFAPYSGPPENTPAIVLPERQEFLKITGAKSAECWQQFTPEQRQVLGCTTQKEGWLFLFRIIHPIYQHLPVQEAAQRTNENIQALRTAIDGALARAQVPAIRALISCRVGDVSLNNTEDSYALSQEQVTQGAIAYIVDEVRYILRQETLEGMIPRIEAICAVPGTLRRSSHIA